MTKTFLIVLAIVVGIIFLGSTTNSFRNKKKLQQLEQKLEIAEDKTEKKATETIDSALQKFDGLRIVISEEDLNTQFEKQLTKQPETDNMIADGSVDLEEGVGRVSLIWEKGQAFTSNVVVAEDGKTILVQDVQIEGAGFLTGILESVAKTYLQTLFADFIDSKGKLVNGIEIKEGSLVIYHSLEN